MENTSENKTKNHPASPKRICLGILAHVDAGKTTLSEAMLYGTGAIRKMGRVDDGSAFLDTYRLERDRGRPSLPCALPEKPPSLSAALSAASSPLIYLRLQCSRSTELALPDMMRALTASGAVLAQCETAAGSAR